MHDHETGKELGLIMIHDSRGPRKIRTAAGIRVRAVCLKHLLKRGLSVFQEVVSFFVIESRRRRTLKTRLKEEISKHSEEIRQESPPSLIIRRCRYAVHASWIQVITTYPK
jgi:hypothetical protein